MKQYKSRLLTSACAVAAFGFAFGEIAPAFAQLDEIIVTTRKREESYFDVPVAITVLGETAIESVSPVDLQDLTGLAPNMFIGMNTAGPGASAIFSRGQGYADIEKTQNPAVGVSIDGMFIGTSTGQLLDAFDLQQVEINRGPQGLLFGKNTTAGVIDVKRTRPTGEFGVKGSASYGSYDERIFKMIVNMPSFANDAIAVKVGLTHRQHDGYYGNVYSGGRGGDFEYDGVHAMVSLNPTEWMDGLIVYDFTQQRGGGQPVQNANSLNERTLGTAVANPGGLGAHQVATDFDQGTTYDATRISGEFNFDTPIGTLTSITAYFDTSDRVTQDFDATCSSNLLGVGCAASLSTNPLFPVPALHTDRDQQYDQFTQEIRLVTDLGEVFGELPLIHGATLTTGGYYFNGDIQLIQNTDLGLPTVVPMVEQFANEQTRSYAGFAAMDFDLTERLSISAGGRFIREEKDFTNVYFTRSNLGPAATISFGPIIGVTLPRRTQEEAFEAWTTKFGIDYEVMDDVLVYFSRSEGFRSGGFSIRATGAERFAGVNSCAPGVLPGPLVEACPGNNFFTYEPEKNTTYELGVKGGLFDNTLLANLTGFWQKVEDYQVSTVTNTPGFPRATSTYINNFQEIGGWGVEAEFVWDVPNIEGLTLTAVGGYQDLEIKEAMIDARRLPVGPLGQPGSPAQGLIDVSGNALGRTPEFQYSLSGTYETHLWDQFSMNTSFTWRYQDDFVIGALGTLTDVQEAYGLLDGRVTLISDKGWELSAIGKNLTNKDYRNNSLPSVNFQGWGNPQIFTIEIKAEF